MKYIKFVVSMLIITALLMFCSNSTEPTADESGNNNSEVPAVFQTFTDNVNVSADGDFLVVETDDIPDHNSPYFSQSDNRYEAYNGSNSNFNLNPNRINTQSITLRIPLKPSQASTHEGTPLGPIGISVNGVVLFNQYAGPNQPLTGEIDSFDQYNGHPQQSGQYHYHVEPLYLTSLNGKGSLIGWLLDGFPVYGPQENGQNVSSADLDQYHGHSHTTSEYPNGIYHYHITSDDPYINGGQFFGSPGSVTQ